MNKPLVQMLKSAEASFKPSHLSLCELDTSVIDYMDYAVFTNLVLHFGYLFLWISPTWLGYEWFPVIFFGATSIIGIVAFMYEYVRYEKNHSQVLKVLALITLAFSLFYIFILEWELGFSTMVWHIGHIFISHGLLSFLPAIIAWGVLFTAGRRES